MKKLFVLSASSRVDEYECYNVFVTARVINYKEKDN